MAEDSRSLTGVRRGRKPACSQRLVTLAVSVVVGLCAASAGAFAMLVNELKADSDIPADARSVLARNR